MVNLSGMMAQDLLLKIGTMVNPMISVMNVLNWMQLDRGAMLPVHHLWLLFAKKVCCLLTLSKLIYNFTCSNITCFTWAI